MSTILPLFWNLSSAHKKERIDASVSLVGALERFQTQFTPKPASSETAEEEDDDEHAQGLKDDALDTLNATDVAYSIRRLVRGLASPRESSRLGFAVALTELLARIDSVTCSQIVNLIIDSAKPQGGMTGQEERDILFSLLFGLTAVIQSGLLVRTTPLSTSASSAPAASTPAAFHDVLTQLAAIGEKKAWLRESAWWTIGLAIDALDDSEVAWKDAAFEDAVQTLFVEDRMWTPEKIALALKLQTYRPQRDWHATMAPTFKHAHVLHPGNHAALARILKESSVEEDDDAERSGAKAKNGLWKPQVHFVWDVLLDALLSADETDAAVKGSFPEFFRILVDESFFSATSSSERKYWGFQIFQKALPRVQAADMPMLFTKNFMRSWINHLSNSDRYLHKAAKQVANDIQAIVKTNPALGFALLLELTGAHGSHQFDRLTKTKTVETILASMHQEGIQNYIEYLLKQVNDDRPADGDVHALSARRAWIVEQLAALVRNGAVPKDDKWVQTVLDWFVVHGLFAIRKRSEKARFLALHDVPTPVFSDALRKACRAKLLSCLADLTTHTTLVTIDDKASKMAAVASDGEFWVLKVLATIDELGQDAKHVSLLCEVGDEDRALRAKARQLAERLNKISILTQRGQISGEQREAAKGAELLLSATLLHQYCVDDDDEDEAETLQSCIDAASQMFPAEGKKSKKSKKSRKSAGGDGAEPDEPLPVDVLVDTLIGFLEQATAYMRAVANQVFTLLSGSVQESTIDLILAQLERKTPEELAQNDEEDEDDAGMDVEDAAENGEDGPEEESDEESVLEDEDEDLDELADPELRKKIEDALRVNGVQPATGDSDSESEEELMDDEQMMAIDSQLAAVFKARAGERKLGRVDAQREATHYKNRVLDLLDAFVRKQPASPLILRLVLPLVEIVSSSGSDEKQLADKTKGILRARLGKAKDTPAEVDSEQAAEILREVHVRARKAVSPDLLVTLDQCSLFLVKCLLQAQAEAPVLDAYRASLREYITRKSSRLNNNFFQDFIRRHPSVAWELRTEFLEVVGDAVNGYRKTQVFHLLDILLQQTSSLSDKHDEILEFMTSLSPVVQTTIRDACKDSDLTTAQFKSVLKTAQGAVRHAKRVLSPEELHQAWDHSSWESVSQTLASSEKFKSSTALHNACKQLVKSLEQTPEVAKPSKRKADALAETQDADVPKKKKISKKNKV